MKKDDRCELCGFAVTNAEMILCHRNPPICVDFTPGKLPIFSFPKVSRNYWCGEFKARKE